MSKVIEPYMSAEEIYRYCTAERPKQYMGENIVNICAEINGVPIAVIRQKIREGEKIVKQGRKITEEELQLAEKYRASGMLWREIAAELGRAECSIVSAYNKWLKERKAKEMEESAQESAEEPVEEPVEEVAEEPVEIAPLAKDLLPEDVPEEFVRIDETDELVAVERPAEEAREPLPDYVSVEYFVPPEISDETTIRDICALISEYVAGSLLEIKRLEEERKRLEEERRRIDDQIAEVERGIAMIREAAGGASS